MEPSLEVLAVSADVSVATFHNVLLIHFRGETPLSCVAMLRASMQKLPETGKVIFFAVIETTSVPPNQEARAAFAKFFEDYSTRLGCAIITIRGGGFRAAMVRTITSGILHLLPRFRVPFPKHIGGSLDEAAAHANANTPQVSPTALLGAFRALSDMPARQ